MNEAIKWEWVKIDISAFWWSRIHKSYTTTLYLGISFQNVLMYLNIFLHRVKLTKAVWHTKHIRLLLLRQQWYLFKKIFCSVIERVWTWFLNPLQTPPDSYFFKYFLLLSAFWVTVVKHLSCESYIYIYIYMYSFQIKRLEDCSEYWCRQNGVVFWNIKSNILCRNWVHCYGMVGIGLPKLSWHF